jgi:hypothetical protein
MLSPFGTIKASKHSHYGNIALHLSFFLILYPIAVLLYIYSRNTAIPLPSNNCNPFYTTLCTHFVTDSNQEKQFSIRRKSQKPSAYPPNTQKNFYYIQQCLTVYGTPCQKSVMGLHTDILRANTKNVLTDLKKSALRICRLR